MDKNTIVIVSADHGELGGNHQMRGKGTNAYWQQNHLPLMIHHPAFAGGTECAAITSQLDLTPTIIGLTGTDAAARARASEGLKGSYSWSWLHNPAQAGLQSIRPASLYNFDMLSFQDPKWAALTVDTRAYRTKTPQEQLAMLAGHPPNFLNRVAIRSIWGGRYRFSRCFSPVRFNTPSSLEKLFERTTSRSTTGATIRRS